MNSLITALDFLKRHDKNRAEQTSWTDPGCCAVDYGLDAGALYSWIYKG